MEWETVTTGGGKFVKFEQAGQVVEGVLRAQRQGEYGALYDIQQQDGSLLTLGDSHMLRENLPHLIGKVIRIEYRGKKGTKSGKTVKDFLIQAAKADPAAYVSDAPAAVAEDDDSGLPF